MIANKGGRIKPRAKAINGEYAAISLPNKPKKAKIEIEDAIRKDIKPTGLIG